MGTLLCLLAFAGFAIIDWMAVARERKRVEYVAKPATLAALLLFATTGAAPSGWLIAALVLSLLGDVFLMLPEDLFAAGLVAFLLGHLAYIADFDAALTARLLWWVVILAASWPLSRRIVRSVTDATLRPAVVLYMGVIAFMVASACASGTLVAVLGAGLFFCSDAIIAWNRFVQPQPWARLAIIVTYHVGQLLLVTALRAG